jgi:hypothetical protein
VPTWRISSLRRSTTTPSCIRPLFSQADAAAATAARQLCKQRCTRRSFNKDFLLALAADFKRHGPQAIEKVRKQQPAAYLKICALLVPREMKLEHSGGVKALTDEQLERTLAYLEEVIARRDGGASAKVIEGEAEVVPSLPAPGSGGAKMPKA